MLARRSESLASHFVEIRKLPSKFSPSLAKGQRLKREGKDITRFAYLFDKPVLDFLWRSVSPKSPHTSGSGSSF